MKVKIIFLLFAASISGSSIKAQELKDNFYVKLLQEELQRNIKRLHLPELGKPFLISYQLRNQYGLGLNAERGEITSQVKEPLVNKMAWIKLRVGDYHRNFDYMIFDGYRVSFPDENDVDEYRRLLWLETDRAYKNNSRQYSSFMSSLKRLNVDEKELALDDLGKITPVQKDFGAAQPIHINVEDWEKKLKSLSALFKQHPSITTSYCRLTINSFEDYIVSSEGTIIRKPGGDVSFVAYGAAFDDKGDNFNSNYSVTVKNIDELPSFDELEASVKKLIEKISEKEKAPSFEGSYMGPVLFTGEAVTDIVLQCFNSSLKTTRKSILGYGPGGTDYEEKLGQKLVSSDLSVIARPALKKFNGQSLTGYFPIDEQGVQPPDSLVLIEAGILKSLLNGRTPTRKFSTSQGFDRSFAGRAYNAGVLELRSAKMVPQDSMYSQLIRLAKEEGLPSAYIVDQLSMGRTEVYKIDVATGKIEMLKECKITPLNQKSLRRFVVASHQQQVKNQSGLSVLAPQSIIVNEVEIEKNEITTKPKPIIVSNPLLEKQVAEKKPRRRR